MGKLSIFEMVIICLKWFIRQIDQLKEDLVECETGRVNWKDSSDAFEQENNRYKAMIYAIEQEIKCLKEGGGGFHYATYLEIKKIIND